MSKPALGRGLASLLTPSERKGSSLPTNATAPSPDAAGVQLLLRGFVAEHVASQREYDRAMAERPAMLLLAIPLLWVADAVMVAVAAWAVLTVHQPIRFLIATVLIVVGGMLGCLAAWLNGSQKLDVAPEVAPAPEIPRIRIRLMDDRPAVRANSTIR